MPTWYLGKIRHQQEQENGALKTFNEAYLLDAVSYTDAEARLYKIGEELHREFNVMAISRLRLADVFFIEEGGDNWFKCKVVYTTLDEKSGKEKKVVQQMLVNAENPKQAYERIERSLSTMLIPFDITDVNLTPILEVYPYEAPEEQIPANFKPLSELKEV
jgi:Domain of unknown function (DUF4494)